MKTTTSAKALDFTRHTHPGHKGRGFHPKTQKSGQRSMYPLFPPKSWPTEKDRPTSVVAEFVKTILSRRGGNVLVSGGTRDCFGGRADNLQNTFSAASYRTLKEIGGIARTAKIAKN
jgi:hypothetical protein